MKVKKYIASVVLMAMLLLSFTVTKAASFTQDELYKSSITRLESLGIMDSNELEAGSSSSIVSREEFAKSIVKASGLEYSAVSLRGVTIFPDVTPGSELSGYVNTVLTKKTMTGLLDGRFHPEGSISFAQACTIMVKALGYEDADLTGMWPKNYMLKAAEVGLVSGIDLNASQSLPRWAAAVMYDRLLDAKVKDSDKTFGEVSGVTAESNIYGQISNPVYSQPEIVTNFNAESKRIGAIDLSGNPKIIRNGQLIDIADINENEVVYEVTDIWGSKRYILVVDNSVSGVITNISPTAVQIDGTDYQFARASTDYTSYSVNDYVTAYLGYDGKVVNFWNFDSQENGKYAFVVNTSVDGLYYTAKMMTVDGNIRTYNTQSNYASLKGQLVEYEVSGDRAVLKSVKYKEPGECVIQKDTRKVDGDYVSPKAAIFNLISDLNDVKKDEDVEVSVIKWSDMPNGTIDDGQILHLGKSGEFNDINLILVEDVLYDQYKKAIVTDVTFQTEMRQEGDTEVEEVVSTQYTLLIDGKEYNYTFRSSKQKAEARDVVRVRMSNDTVTSIVDVQRPVKTDAAINAIDSNRIKADGETYYLSNNLQVYVRDRSGKYILSNIGEIASNKDKRVTLYLNKTSSSSDTADVIILRN
ncbi:surface layer protein precursor [Oxobacter pfennigii]|uniref:Surface layer protein n=1 Tax=Oxobacter pfennigii TaxID=36849 RepID=A0A0N8NT37_9CLOT|nr:S-layer homology domain-containing protein [Oxobacter pfennigii]KPU43744.1 surface layer protein precursor [Oxobacter pfennigii]